MDKLNSIAKIEGEENKINQRTSAVAIVILICICLFHIINNYLWIKADVLSWYPEKYYQLINKNTVFFSLENIIHNNQSLLGKFISSVRLIKIDNGWGWGGIFYIYTAGINAMFGNTIDVSLLANIPIFILLIIFTFLIGKKIAGDQAGIFAAFLVSFYPGIYGMSRSYGVDFPLVAMVTLSACILITQDIIKIRHFLLFGLIMGLTLLIKVTGLFFLIGPFLYIFYQRIYSGIKSKQKDKLIFRGIFWLFFSPVLFIVMLLIFLYFGWGPVRLFYLLGSVRLFNFPMFSHWRHFYGICPYNTVDLRSIFFYAFEMVHSMSRPLFFLFCAGLLLFLKNKVKHKMVILLWISVPYVILALNINKWGRYYFPALPALALITAIGIFQIKARKYKIILVTLVVSLSLIQFYDLSFGSAILPQALYKHPDYSFAASPPQKCQEEKVITRFLEIINKEKKDPNYKCKILFVAPHSIIDYGKLEYIFQVKEPGIEFAKFFTVGSGYGNCDYIIVLNDQASGASKPDLSFLKTPEYYRDFLKVSYSQYYLSNAELEKMYDVFTKFKVVDYYFTDNLFFYLCKNTKG
jgi:hypothetical protein